MGLVDDPAADLLDQKSDRRDVRDRFAQALLRELRCPGGTLAGKILGLPKPGPAQFGKRLLAARGFPDDGEREIETGQRYAGVGKTIANPDQQQVGIGLRVRPETSGRIA
jgi:hypothetical protein